MCEQCVRRIRCPHCDRMARVWRYDPNTMQWHWGGRRPQYSYLFDVWCDLCATMYYVQKIITVKH